MAEKGFHQFTWGEKQDPFTDEDAKKEFGEIQEKLRVEAQRIPIPEALDAKHMMSLLENEVPGETKPPLVVNYKKEYLKIVAYAACFVLVISGMMKIMAHQINRSLADTAAAETVETTQDEIAVAAVASERDDDDSAADAVRNAGSYDAIYESLLSAQSTRLMASQESTVGVSGEGDDLLALEAAAEESETSGEDGDLVKSEGDYLYQYRSSTGELRIVRQSDLAIMATIPISDVSAQEIILVGDRLVLIAQDESDAQQVASTAGDLLTEILSTGTTDSETLPKTTSLFVYDVSDKANPTQCVSFRQAGEFSSFCLVNRTVYLVSEWTPAIEEIGAATNSAALFPSYERDGEPQLVSAEDIFLADDLSTDAKYVVFTAVDVDTGETVTKAALCSSDVSAFAAETGDEIFLNAVG